MSTLHYPNLKHGIICLIALAVILLLPAVKAHDLNGNGISDLYEQTTGIPTDPNIDSDGDGQSNLIESMAGTNPWNGSYSVNARFQCQLEQVGTGINVKWWGVKGKHYQVETSSNLTANWLPFGTTLVGNNAWLTQAETTGGVAKFYRIRILPSENPDNDPLDDWGRISDSCKN